MAGREERTVFSNLNWYNVVILLLLALFVFGDKLPQIIADGLRLLRNLRRMAQNATSDLSRELGTDVRLEDLHPKAFVRKHLLSEEDQEKLLQPLKGVSEDVVRQTRGLQQELRDLGGQEGGATGANHAAAGNGRRAGRQTRRGAGAGDGDAASTDTGAAAAEPGAPATGAAGEAAAGPKPPARPGYDDIT